MGNPKGVTTIAAPNLAGSSNGIFAAVPGEIISAGIHTLPAPETLPDQTATVVTDAGDLGRVRITYVSTLLKHRRSSYWAWLPTRVDSEPA